MKQRQHTDIYKETRKRLEQESCALQALAELDGLTGLYNRITIGRRVDDHLYRKQPGTMIVLDLSHLRRVSNRCDYIAGDMLLCTIVNVLKKMFSGRNLMGHVGGDEFVAFVPFVLDDPITAGECLRIQEWFRKMRLGDSILIKLSITIDSVDSRTYTKYRDMFDYAGQKIMTKKRLHDLKDDTGLISPSREPVGIQPDMSLTVMEMKEKETWPRAYYQDYGTFKQTCRLGERRLKGDKKGVLIILLTLTDRNNGFLPLDKRDAEMDILGGKIEQSLRTGNVYTRCSSCQYLVMVLDVSIENVGVIVDHIYSIYYQMYQETADNLILHHNYPLKPARGWPKASRPQWSLNLSNIH